MHSLEWVSCKYSPKKGYNDLSVRGVSLSGPVKLSHLFGLSVSGTLRCLQVLLCGQTSKVLGMSWYVHSLRLWVLYFTLHLRNNNKIRMLKLLACV